MVIWVVGLSGSGKTVLGREIYKQWKETDPNTVLVDGDEIRAIFKHNRDDNAYSIEGRKKNADIICEMCKWLDKQEINVVCCILSIFEESRKWNRQNFSKYFETYISVPLETLKKRDIKNLYKPALNGKIKNVVGVDIPFNEPQQPDFVFKNHETLDNFSEIASEILYMALQKEEY